MSPFYYDIVCPYAYMGFKILERNGVFEKNLLELKPILLGGVFKQLGTASDPNQTMAKEKAAYIRHDVARQAQFFGVPLQFHERHPVSTVKAMRLLHACNVEQRVALTSALYEAYWVHNRNLDDENVINELAAHVNLGECGTYYDRAKEALLRQTNEAVSASVFGVPTIIHKGQRYFGADRLYLLKHELSLTLPDSSWHATQKPIDFYFDFSSPYSYLAYLEVAQAMRAGTKFTFKPILLGALFKELGVHNIPMLNAHPSKTKYFLEDMTLWAKHRNSPFTFSSHFPIRSVMPLRIALLDPATIGPMFTAAWVHDVHIADPDCLHDVLTRAGLDAKALMARADDDAVKNQLKNNTALALSRGVFGVPTFFVGEEKVFGQDRFPWIKHAVSKQV